jgi:glycolate oxidase iron-sulfur subunit
VEYAQILEHFRADMEQAGGRPPAESFVRRQLLNMLASPARLVLALRASRLLARLAGPAGTLPRPVAALLTGRPGAEVTLPAAPDRPAVGRLNQTSPAIGEQRARVGVLAGCVMRVFYHDTNTATVRVLQRNGCEVVAPRAAGCCGALHLHSGYMDDAKRRGRALIDAFHGTDIDALVVNSAGCGSTLKEYGALFADDPVYADEARAFAAKVRDVSEFLIDLGLRPPERTLDCTVAYHDACHLAHGQRITAAPRQLLRAIPGLRLVELAESDTCCGSAGIYNLVEPDMARRLLERKIGYIEASGATVVATGNPGCLAWIRQGLQERGLDVAIRHPVDLLDEAYEGYETS